MRDVEVRYDIIEKKEYALVQALKAFIIYVLHSSIIVYVPKHAVKTFLTLPDTDGKRGRWIANIPEFDLDIRITKLVKGKGLAKFLAESNCKVLGINSILQSSSEKNLEEPSSSSNEKNPQEPSLSSSEKNP